MSISSVEYIILGIAAFVLSGLLTWPVRALAIKLGAMDLPNLDRKTHKEPVPYLGGVSIALTITLISFASVLYSDNEATTFPLITYALLPALVLGIMGLIDDLRGLPPLPRLVIQSLVGVVVALFLISENIVGSPLGNPTLDLVINVVWIVGICNSINFFDNLDGGAAGTVAISTLGIAAIAMGQKQELVSALAIVTAGATIGFLMWNKSPAKIYMGDAGALFLGIIVSVLTIRLNPGIEPKWSSVALFPILLAVPILDTCIAVFSRIKRGISPLTGGKDHLSHRLMRKGLSKRATAYCLWSMQASFVVLAFLAYKWSSAVGMQLVIFAGACWLMAFIWFWRIPSAD